MIPDIRHWFNQNFTDEKYQQYVKLLNKDFLGKIEFRIAETPIFVDADFTQKMLSTCEDIIDLIAQPGFKAMTDAALPQDYVIENEGSHPDFIVFDFGICQGENGQFTPQLIEMQGFPSLFMYQLYQDEAARGAYGIPSHLQTFLNGYDKDSVIALLREVIVGQHLPENVILLELFPEQQKTAIDFLYTQLHLGVTPVCLTKIFKQGRNLYYKNSAGKEIKIERIYNRLIFDEIRQHADPFIAQQAQLLTGDIAVEWVTHPNWFYRISKFTLPFIQHPHVPETRFLNDLLDLPQDLENYVLKPLFSYAGHGVVIDIQPEDILRIEHPENYIIQKKVQYAAAIETPDEPAKAEIRIFYVWKDGALRPVATHNLARITKDKMIGVGYNQDKKWVGGSLAYFEGEK